MAKIQVEINGQLHDVKRVQLFDLAKRGVITPDTRIIYNDRELAADMVKGLEFNVKEDSISNVQVPHTPIEVPLPTIIEPVFFDVDSKVKKRVLLIPTILLTSIVFAGLIVGSFFVLQPKSEIDRLEKTMIVSANAVIEAIEDEKTTKEIDELIAIADKAFAEYHTYADNEGIESPEKSAKRKQRIEKWKSDTDVKFETAYENLPIRESDIEERMEFANQHVDIELSGEEPLAVRYDSPRRQRIYDKALQRAREQRKYEIERKKAERAAQEQLEKEKKKTEEQTFVNETLSSLRSSLMIRMDMLEYKRMNDPISFQSELDLFAIDIEGRLSVAKIEMNDFAAFEKKIEEFEINTVLKYYPSYKPVTKGAQSHRKPEPDEKPPEEPQAVESPLPKNLSDLEKLKTGVHLDYSIPRFDFDE